MTKSHQSIDNQPQSLTERVSRGDINKSVKLEGIPVFGDKYKEREWVKEHMAAAFRFWGNKGYGEGMFIDVYNQKIFTNFKNQI